MITGSEGSDHLGLNGCEPGAIGVRGGGVGGVVWMNRMGNVCVCSGFEKLLREGKQTFSFNMVN